MNVVEISQVASASLPLNEFADYLKVGRALSGPTPSDVVLEHCLRASLSAIEARTGRALISRDFSWQVTKWRDPSCTALPIAPVVAIVSLTVVDNQDVQITADVTSYRLSAGTARPRIAATGASLPDIDEGGHADIVITAGYGTWGDIPHDLQQAVFLLAANYYEKRNDLGSDGLGMPFGVLALIESYRSVRLLRGDG